MVSSRGLTRAVAMKKLSHAQLQALDKSVAKIVADCVDESCNCTTGGFAENEWETLHFPSARSHPLSVQRP